MPKVTQEYRDAKREEIVDAAWRCFSAKGFQATSMADIIAESNLSAGAIYGHFAGKQDIMIAVAQRVMTDRAAELRELAARSPVPPPREVIALMASVIPRDDSGTPLMLQVWGEAAVDPEFKRLASYFVESLMESVATYFAAWGRWSRGLEGEAATAWAVSISPVALGVLQGYFIQSTLYPSFDAESYLDVADGVLR